jgi:uncharacterized protein with PIN domain
MANKSKCPYCNATITRLNVEEIELERDSGGPWKGISLACPVCRKIITVGIHPDFANQKLGTQLQSMIEAALKK